MDLIVPMATIYDKEHNSHAHLINLTTASGTHSHAAFNSYSYYCLFGDHLHLCTVGESGGHTHTFLVWSSTESATDLNHTHTFSDWTYPNTYPHTHSATTIWTGHCADATCTANPHTHPYSGVTTSGGNSHSHAVSGTTGTGNGTLYWHNHYIAMDITSADSHTHTSSPDLGNAYCWYSHLHSHVGGVIPVMTHNHGLGGYTDYAGEPPPAPTVRTFPTPVY